MKKRFFIYVITGLLLAGTIAGAAAVTADKIFGNNETVIGHDEKERREDAERRAKIDTRKNGTVSWESLSKFERMLIAMDATIDNAMDYNNILFNYEYLKQAYHFTAEELDYISDLIIKGYKAEDIMDICFFWLDTNEDIGIIEEMYLQKGIVSGKTWIEGAFNKVTGDKYGVLNEEDVSNYAKYGISAGDILTANRLSRKGVFTINEILDMRITGRTYAEIAAEISGEDTDELPTEILEQSAIAVQAYSLTDNPEAKQTEEDVISAEIVLKTEELVRIEGKARKEYYQKEIDGESVDEILRETEDEIKNGINNELHTNGLYKTVSDADEESYRQRELKYENK